MQRYYYTATVEKKVVDTINICVEAEDNSEAYKLIDEAVKIYPEPVPHSKIKHMFVENRDTISSKIIDLERKVPVG